MTNAIESNLDTQPIPTPARALRSAWASAAERDEAISALVEHLLIHLPGISAATQALSITGSGAYNSEQEPS